MRKLTASFILGTDGLLHGNHTLVINDGAIVDLVQEVVADAEFFEGILAPGFINTHCHLELSHLKGKISQAKQLDGFIREFVAARKTYTHGVEESIREADSVMWENGIQGTGDICNTDYSFKVKKISDVRYHNFIELFNMDPMQAAFAFSQGEDLYHKSQSAGLSASIVPHAPYSVPAELFRLIADHHKKNNSLWCIHNQETASENEMFKSGTGKLSKCFEEMGIDRTWFIPYGKNSLESICTFFPSVSKLLFIHNTFTAKEDIEFLNSTGRLKQMWFGLCPKANLFIENRLPDIPLFFNYGCNITIGTDSLASNDTLSILEELKVLNKAFPTIPVSTLLTWATKNGADYFGWNDFGSFRKGNRPGVIQITASNRDSIGENASVNRII